MVSFFIYKGILFTDQYGTGMLIVHAYLYIQACIQVAEDVTAKDVAEV